MNSKAVKVNMGFMPGTIYVYYGDHGRKLSIRTLKRIGASQDDISEFKNKKSTANGLCVLEKTNCVIWVEDMFDFAVLAHEIFHAVSGLFRFAGLSLTESSEEAYAYAISHVTDQILRKTRID